VQDKAKPGVELCPIDPGAEQKIPDHKMDHVNERRGRWFEYRQPFERRIPFTAETQDLIVKVLLAREMPEQQGFGNPRRLGELLCRRSGEALAGKERDRRRDDRLAAFVAIQSGYSHARQK